MVITTVTLSEKPEVKTSVKSEIKPGAQASVKPEIKKWHIFEAELQGESDGNPYREAELTADFSNGTERFCVRGFYCDHGRYKVRFMPNQEGEWKGTVRSSDPAMNGLTVSFTCTSPNENDHGRVLPKNEVIKQKMPECFASEARFHFAYEDGTDFQPFGTTCYAWINQKESLQEATLQELKNSPFNKIRMCLFPKFYTYNTTDPENYLFQKKGSPDAVGEEGFDFTRFNEAYWQNLEKRLAQLDDLGIQADLILLHPYDKWGFATMSKEQDIYYLTYAVRRLSHFKNVWWSMANEYDLMPQKTIEDWETYARVVMNNDPYGHLRSIHNCMKFYDYSRPWITHCSIQRIDVYKTAEGVNEWRELYQKPVVVDECAYEGNINYGWGNITGEEMTRRFWEGCIRGGYLTHGETYVDRGPEIWWAHGGKLHGTSPKRIRFLKEILADAPDGVAPIKVTPENTAENWDVPSLYKGNEYFLYYFGFFRPSFRTFTLPEGCTYTIELIDTWNRTVTPYEGTYSGSIRLEMPSQQYMAIRMRKVD